MLGRSQQELEPLIQLLRKSKEVVYKCSKIGKYNFVAKNSYRGKLKLKILQTQLRGFSILKC